MPSRSGSKAMMAKNLRAVRDSYPSLFVASDDEWIRKVEAYWKKLRSFDGDAVEKACDMAIDRYPDKMPTVGQLVMLTKGIEAEAKRVLREGNVVSLRIKSDQEETDRVDYLRNDVIPDDPAAQQKWIDDGDSHGERLARSYEVDSKNRKISAHNMQKLHGPRWGDFWKMWDAAGRAKETPKVDEPEQQPIAGGAGKQDAGL